MPQFLLELYVSRTELAAAENGAKQAARAAEQLTAEGTPVRFMRSIFVPDEETCFYLLEAASLEHVRAAAVRAGLPCERIAEALTSANATTS